MTTREVTITIGVNEDGQITASGDVLVGGLVNRANSKHIAITVLVQQGAAAIQELISNLTPAERVKHLAAWCGSCGGEQPCGCPTHESEK